MTRLNWLLSNQDRSIKVQLDEASNYPPMRVMESDLTLESSEATLAHETSDSILNWLILYINFGQKI